MVKFTLHLRDDNLDFNNNLDDIFAKFRVTADHSAATTLGKEARRWSTRIAREVSTIRENNRKLQALYQLKEAGQKVCNTGNLAYFFFFIE